MDYQQIIYRSGKVARIILNRPEYRNAQSRVLLEEMDDAFAKAAVDDEVRVIILSGAGEHFSAGHDLGTPAEKADREKRGFPTDSEGKYNWLKTYYFDNTLRWRNVPKPTIAMVQGYCIFGGWMFAAAMDLIFAADDAKFLSSHFQYFSVPWDLGARKAKELLFESRFITAQEAHENHFVNRVIPREKLEEETLAYANRVAENDPMDVRMSKFSVNNALDAQGFTSSLESAFHAYVLRAQPGQTVEGRRRKPGVELAFQRLKESQSEETQSKETQS